MTNSLCLHPQACFRDINLPGGKSKLRISGKNTFPKEARHVPNLLSPADCNVEPPQRCTPTAGNASNRVCVAFPRRTTTLQRTRNRGRTKRNHEPLALDR